MCYVPTQERKYRVFPPPQESVEPARYFNPLSRKQGIRVWTLGSFHVYSGGGSSVWRKKGPDLCILPPHTPSNKNYLTKSLVGSHRDTTSDLRTEVRTELAVLVYHGLCLTTGLVKRFRSTSTHPLHLRRPSICVESMYELGSRRDLSISVRT